MARIAFAWELGGEYGHAVACSSLAQALSYRGHRIALMFRELRQLALLPEAKGFDVFQAPRSAREFEGAAVPFSYADVLLGCGYAQPRELTALLGGWLSLLRHWRPDVVVADFAPTALIAARLEGLRRVTFGNGFFTPPRLSPLPPFRYDEPAADGRIAKADAQALASVNLALERFGGRALDTLAELFETDEDFLCTFPELDHYAARPVSAYWGPRFRVDRGLGIDWPGGTGKRIFVYVKRNLESLDALIACLAAGHHRIVAFIPDLDESHRRRLAAPQRLVVDRPVRLDALLKHCDLMICHGGEIATGALMYGVPQLVFPTQYEQYLTARRLEQLGSGAWLPPGAASADIAAAVERMLADSRYVSSARKFAQRYSAFTPGEQRRRIIARLEQILASPESTRASPPNEVAPTLATPSTRHGTP